MTTTALSYDDLARRLGVPEAVVPEAADVREEAEGIDGDLVPTEVIREGKSVTYDMKPTRDDPTAVGTSEVADAIIEKLGVRVA